MFIKLNAQQAIFLKKLLDIQIDDMQDEVGEYEFLEENEYVDDKTRNKILDNMIELYNQLDGVEEIDGLEDIFYNDKE